MDEWGNYYNKNNVPCDLPEYVDEGSEDYGFELYKPIN